VRPKSTSWLLALALVLSLAAAACSGDDDDTATARTTTTERATTSTSSSTTTTTPATTVTTVAPTTAPGTPCPVPAFGSVAPQTSPMPSDVMVITAVGARTRDCTDTVTFRFRSGAPEPPGFKVSYEPGPFEEDASGKPISVAGRAFMVVRLEPTTGFDFVANKEAYTGPARFTVPGAYVEEMARTGDFESVTTWLIGLREQVPFTVNATGAPDHRLTIRFG
jgi:hypothetical protein